MGISHRRGLSVLGWGVGGIEAEAGMLGQPISMLIPEVIGFEFKNKMPEGTTATDLVLTVVKILRDKGVVGKFVEFYGDSDELIQEAIDTCPVDCIDWVSFEDLIKLEEILKNHHFRNLGLPPVT